MALQIGSKAPDFVGVTDSETEIKIKRFSRQMGRPLFLSKRQHIGLHSRGLRFP